MISLTPLIHTGLFQQPNKMANCKLTPSLETQGGVRGRSPPYPVRALPPTLATGSLVGSEGWG